MRAPLVVRPARRCASANRVQLLATLDMLTGPVMGAAFPPGQREALAMLAVQLHGQGFGIGLIFFGFACLIRGALIAHSCCLPSSASWRSRCG